MVFWDSVPRCLYKMPSRKMHHYTPYLLCVFNLLLVFTYHVHSFIHCCIHRWTNTIPNSRWYQWCLILYIVPWDFQELKSKLALVNPTFHELVKNFGLSVAHACIVVSSLQTIPKIHIFSKNPKIMNFVQMFMKNHRKSLLMVWMGWILQNLIFGQYLDF